MGPGQDANFAVELTKVAGAATIGALVVIDDGIADGVVLNLVERLLEFEGGDLRELLLESLDQLVFEHVLGRVTGEFARGENRAEDLTADEIAGGRLDFRADGVQFHLTLGLADLLREFLNGRDNFLGVRMGEFDGLHHVRFGNLLASAFDHDQVLLVADVHEVEVAVLALRVRWIDDEFASDAGDAHRGDRAMPGNIGNTQGRGRAVDREHVGIIFGIGAEQDTDDLRVVVKTFGEQRATWAVDHARGEDFLLGGSSLAFEVAAGEFARRRCFLAVVNGEREKVEFVSCGIAGDSGDDQDGFAVGNDGGAIGLFGELAGFDDEFFVPDGDAYSVLHSGIRTPGKYRINGMMSARAVLLCKLPSIHQSSNACGANRLSYFLRLSFLMSSL